MESFLDSGAFPFLVVAVVVGARIVSALRRQKRRRQQENPVPVAPPKASRDVSSWEDEFREPGAAVDGDSAGSAPAQAMPDDDDEAFSAWNLSVNDDPPVPPQAPEAPPKFQETLFRFPEPEAPRPVASIPDYPASMPTQPARQARKSPELRFPGLPPLQQSVIWAEILGKPKGF
jgi:hypothetical protein